MKAQSLPLWTLPELGTQVALALSVDYDGSPSRRVRAMPDVRTIRYYTTLGLIDRPAAMRGRTALYGRRHLLQLVAIKRLQAQGRSLTEIQERLYGRTDADLESLARLPADLPAAPPPPTDLGEPAARSDAFWREPPAPMPEPIAAGETESESTDSESVLGRDRRPLAGPLLGIRLHDDAILLLGAARALDDDDIQAIRTVAAPLIHLLHRRRLLTPRQERN